jgi:hypothetical protein
LSFVVVAVGKLPACAPKIWGMPQVPAPLSQLLDILFSDAFSKIHFSKLFTPS